MTLNANIEWWGGAVREKFSDAAFTIAITQWLLDQIHRDYPNLKPGQAVLRPTSELIPYAGRPVQLC